MIKWIIILVLVLAIIAYYINTVVKSIKLKFTVDNINLQGISLGSLNMGTSFVKTRIQFFIYFQSFFKIRFSQLQLNAYYNNILIARSANNVENKKQVVLAPNVENEVYHTFDLQVNASTIELIAKIKAKQPYQIAYNLSVRLFGVPVKYNSIYISQPSI